MTYTGNPDQTIYWYNGRTYLTLEGVLKRRERDEENTPTPWEHRFDKPGRIVQGRIEWTTVVGAGEKYENVPERVKEHYDLT